MNCVKTIDFTGSLPSCHFFPGGFPTLLNTWPLLRTIKCGVLSANRREIPTDDGKVIQTCTVTKTIDLLLGRWRGSYEHHLPEQWDVTIQYETTLLCGTEIWNKLQMNSIPRALKLPISNLEWNLSDNQTYGNEGLQKLVELRANKELAPIENIHLRNASMYWRAFNDLPSIIGATTKNLSCVVALVHELTDSHEDTHGGDTDADESDDGSEGGEDWLQKYGLGDTTSLANIFVDFDWAAFPVLETFHMRVEVYVQDLSSVKRLCHRVGTTNLDLPPPVYLGRCLNLEFMSIFVELNFKTGSHNCEWTYETWPVDCFPDPEFFAKQLLAVGGLGCEYTIHFGALDDDGDDALEQAGMVYRYLVYKAITKFKLGKVGWRKGGGVPAPKVAADTSAGKKRKSRA